MAKVKFSEKNLRSVEDRLCDYVTAIESGLDINLNQMGACEVCATVTKAKINQHGNFLIDHRDCDSCILSKMTDETDLGKYTCLTQTRTLAVYGTIKNVKARYREIVKHVNKRLAE